MLLFLIYHESKERQTLSTTLGNSFNCVNNSLFYAWCVCFGNRFVMMAKRGYRDPPYHNWLHAFAVVHFCYLLLKNIHWQDYIECVDK